MNSQETENNRSSSLKRVVSWPGAKKEEKKHLDNQLELTENTDSNLKILDLPLITLVTACLTLAMFQYGVSTMDEHNKVVAIENIGKSLNGNLTELFIFDLKMPWYQIWRYITYMFVHDGLEHILLNLYILLVVGFPLENVQGPGRVITIYILGGFNSAVVFAVTKPGSSLIGASGGVFALLFAYIATIFLTRKQRTAYIVQIVLYCLICIISFSFFFINLFNGQSNDGISHMSHLIGGLTGLGWLLVLKNKWYFVLGGTILNLLFVAVCIIYLLLSSNNVADVTQ